ncbi:hypothetical protein, partial [Klebsiella pneumoniae]|uniref:hypothetical protein n=1 Tax=Klebsiella pneumoniae TaxID=573 RepID=UPI00256F2255
ASSVTLSLSARQFAFGAAVPALLASAVALAPAVQAKQSPKAAAKAAAAAAPTGAPAGYFMPGAVPPPAVNARSWMLIDA